LIAQERAFQTSPAEVIDPLEDFRFIRPVDLRRAGQQGMLVVEIGGEDPGIVGAHRHAQVPPAGLRFPGWRIQTEDKTALGSPPALPRTPHPVPVPQQEPS
jgi:hypothetical protein